MAGIWIDRDGTTLSAGAVGKGSPAELAGIKVGDRVGRMAFEELIEAFRGPIGRTLSLTIGKTQRRIDLVLRDYL